MARYEVRLAVDADESPAEVVKAVKDALYNGGFGMSFFKDQFEYEVVEIRELKLG